MRLDPAQFEPRHYDYWTRLVADDEKPAFFATRRLGRDARITRPSTSYRSVVAPADGSTRSRQALYFETKTFLHGLLVVEDKVSMAHGLEAASRSSTTSWSTSRGGSRPA